MEVINGLWIPDILIPLVTDGTHSETHAGLIWVR